MGYRGSKSIVSLNKIKNTFVKEQRVDGSYFRPNQIQILGPKLRYTLMAFERKYPIKNPSKQLNISLFTTLAVLPCVDAVNRKKQIQPSIKNSRALCVHSSCAEDILFNNNTNSINP
jgi:hypothetical protein